MNHTISPGWVTRRMTAVVVASALAASGPAAQERVDGAAIDRIKDEGFNRSQVMQTASWLTDVYGARLTGSPAIRAAGEWAAKQMEAWGATNAKLEPWGPFGRGWTNEFTAVHVASPTPFPVIAYPQAWTPGTSGAVTGEVLVAQVSSPADFDKWRGKLRGKILFTSPARDVKAHDQPESRRLSDEDLAKMASASPPPAAQGGRPGGPPADFQAQMQRRQEEQRAVAQFLVDEGVLATVTSGRGDGGTVFVGGGGSRDARNPTRIPGLTVAVEHYGRILRIVEKGVPVTMTLDVRSTFHDADVNSFNVMADLPGTDATLRDEVVMLGAHFDSWHTGTGATDNAAGSAIMMEAMRILKASGVPLKRTVRMGLWTGEEQGLLGARAYVREHFGDAASGFKPQHGKFSSYFNVDNGTGKIRGVYLQGNLAVGPIFKEWLKPFEALGSSTVTPANTGGTDHQAFDAVGLPGFQFIQDPVEYNTRTHHSNMDVFERLQADDLKHNAVIVAAFVYLAANRPEKLPRKPVPGRPVS